MSFQLEQAPALDSEASANTTDAEDEAKRAENFLHPPANITSPTSSPIHEAALPAVERSHLDSDPGSSSHQETDDDATFMIEVEPVPPSSLFVAEQATASNQEPGSRDSTPPLPDLQATFDQGQDDVGTPQGPNGDARANSLDALKHEESSSASGSRIGRRRSGRLQALEETRQKSAPLTTPEASGSKRKRQSSHGRSRSTDAAEANPSSSPLSPHHAASNPSVRHSKKLKSTTPPPATPKPAASEPHRLERHHHHRGRRFPMANTPAASPTSGHLPVTRSHCAYHHVSRLVGS